MLPIMGICPLTEEEPERFLASMVAGDVGGDSCLRVDSTHTPGVMDLEEGECRLEMQVIVVEDEWEVTGEVEILGTLLICTNRLGSLFKSSKYSSSNCGMTRSMSDAIPKIRSMSASYVSVSPRDRFLSSGLKDGVLQESLGTIVGPWFAIISDLGGSISSSDTPTISISSWESCNCLFVPCAPVVFKWSSLSISMSLLMDGRLGASLVLRESLESSLSDDRCPKEEPKTNSGECPMACRMALWCCCALHSLNGSSISSSKQD